ncbi:MAG: tetratricopeptide repeat protein [Rhodocyclaceae bacterium]|nr:tetratricopeptide repeat protein [Rhodocyclaceae bacterium]
MAPETGKWSSSGEAAGAAAPGRISKTPRLPAGRAERAELAYREGRAALQAGRVRAAIETLQGALAEQPGHQAARETLARALIGERRLDEAQALLRDGLALDPAAAALAHWLARILLAEAQPDAALGAIDAIPAAALRAEDHALRGGLLDRLKRPQEAAAAYRAALAARPGEALWWLGLGVALDAAGQSDAARAALQQARALGGLNAELTAYVERRLN